MKRLRDNRKPFAKSVGSSAEDNPDTLPPVFSLEHMRDRSGYSVTCCDSDDQAALSRKLFQLSQMKWRDIRHAPKHGLGSEIIDRSSLKVPLPTSVTEDTTILAIRFSGMKPMVGYREGRVFYIILLDHQFTAYRH